MYLLEIIYTTTALNRIMCDKYKLLYSEWYNVKINVFFSDMNFSKNLCYTHKNDYMFYSTSVEGQSVKVFVTKSYKLVKINFNSEYIFDVEDFITLLASSIC